MSVHADQVESMFDRFSAAWIREGVVTPDRPDAGDAAPRQPSALLRREGDGWRFVDARPYVFAAVPG